MRELILQRIQEIRTTIGSDLFVKCGRKRKVPPGRWRDDFDFTKLTEAELVAAFERLVWRAYRQR